MHYLCGESHLFGQRQKFRGRNNRTYSFTQAQLLWEFPLLSLQDKIKFLKSKIAQREKIEINLSFSLLLVQI